MEWTHQNRPEMVDSSLLQEVAISTELVSFSEWKDAESREPCARHIPWCAELGPDSAVSAVGAAVASDALADERPPDPRSRPLPAAVSDQLG